MAVKIGKAVIASRARTVKVGAVPARPPAYGPPVKPSWRARTVMFRHPMQWFLVRHMGYTPAQAKKGIGGRIRRLFTPQTEAVRRQLPHLFNKK
ncbi:unnamed protein product [marine sediment metagenome]|uniref:Uncharacterized protein n=1 Tax=marine sediment metagenome TaxID=412755 RepID=X1IK46_9ZZZZ